MPKLIRHQMASGIQEACEELLANSNEWAFLKSLLQSVEALGYAASAKPETIARVAQSLESSLRNGSAGEMDQILRWRRLGHLLRNLSYSGDMVALAMQQLELGYHAEALTLRESGELEMLRAVCDFLGSLSRARPIVFDVGANCGEWMHAVSVFSPTAELHAFEPQVQLLPLLSAEADRIVSELPNVCIRINPCGLSDCDGIAELFMSSKSDVLASTLDSVRRASFSETSTCSAVPLLRGDSYCEAVNIRFIDCLKVDVEGAEMKVLKGFEQMIGRASISLIQFEYGRTTALAGCSLRDFYDFLGRDYCFLRISPEGYIVVDSQNVADYEDFRWANYLAVHRSLEQALLAFLRAREEVV